MPRYIAKRIVLQGRVQGVGCRRQVLDLADSIGHLSGYVRNIEDGRVEVAVNGPDWRVEDFEKFLRDRLSPPVVVERLLSEDVANHDWPPGFVIRR